MRKSIGYAIQYTNIVNFVAKHRLVVNHVALVKDTDSRIRKVDPDEQHGLGIILCNSAENVKHFIINFQLLILLINDKKYVEMVSFLSVCNTRLFEFMRLHGLLAEDY